MFPDYKEEEQLDIFLSLESSASITGLSVVVYWYDHINTLEAYYIIKF